MTRAEVIRVLERTMPMFSGSTDARDNSIHAALVAARDLLEADGGRTHYDAAAVERARIREALVEQLALHDRHPRFAVLAEDIEREIERVCGPTGAGGHEG